MPGNAGTARRLALLLDAELGQAECRRFPDGESYVRIDSDVKGRDLVIVCALDRPDDKFLPLAFLAATARDLGAATIGLVAPYLSYMRQDTRFRPGEGITSAYFATLMSRQVDWLVTIDPHLHRRKDLSEIYPIRCKVAHAGPLIADWIRTHVRAPVVVGPDSESEQWVTTIAAGAEAPYIMLEKTRFGDREVRVSAPDVGRWIGRTPVLVDDIVSTARTMIETATRFREAGFTDMIAVGIHALFAGNAYSDLLAAGAGRIVTCNTVLHPSNAIDVTEILAAEVRNAAKFTSIYNGLGKQ
jgi:ribose-phosphate pyrophosphokinase